MKKILKPTTLILMGLLMPAFAHAETQLQIAPPKMKIQRSTTYSSNSAHANNGGGYSGPQTSGQAIPIQMDHDFNETQIEEQVTACFTGIQDGQQGQPQGDFGRSPMWNLMLQIAHANQIPLQAVRLSSEFLEMEVNPKSESSWAMLVLPTHGHGVGDFGQMNCNQDYSRCHHSVALPVDFGLQISSAPRAILTDRPTGADLEMSGLGGLKELQVATFDDVTEKEFDINGIAHSRTIYRNLTLHVLPETLMTGFYLNATTKRATPYRYDLHGFYSCVLNGLQK